ncbi:MAG: DUF427 domain-containing protein [Roseiarcus sp.]
MDHPITIGPAPGRVVVRWRGRVIVDTRDALELREADYPPVLYFPRADADMTVILRSIHESTCRFKGKANYFSLVDGAALAANAVWTYETPLEGLEAIKDRLAFHPDKVEIERVEAGA